MNEPDASATVRLSQDGPPVRGQRQRGLGILTAQDFSVRFPLSGPRSALCAEAGWTDVCWGALELKLILLLWSWSLSQEVSPRLADRFLIEDV